MENINYDGTYELKDIPTRFEAGTQNIEGVIGLGTAIDYLNNIGIEKIHKYEIELKKYLIERLKEVDNINIYNKDINSNTLLFNIDKVFAQDTSIYLNKHNICVRAGNHCAKILKDELKVANTCRVSLYFYNTKQEIDTFVETLKKSYNIFKEVI